MTEEECWRHLQSLPIPPKVLQALPLLMKPLTLEVVVAALERLKGGSAPGKDGIPAEHCQAFPSVFAPRLLLAMQCFLREGGVPAEWSLSLMRCLPKFWGAEQPKDMRPIALQQVLPEVGDHYSDAAAVRRVATGDPTLSKGVCIGHQMLDHVIFARAEWERVPD